MMTALLAARNILGMGKFDTWKVNTDAEYHEGETPKSSRKAGRACRSASARREGWAAKPARNRRFR